jgi:hypothetical protein
MGERRRRMGGRACGTNGLGLDNHRSDALDRREEHVGWTDELPIDPWDPVATVGR